MYKLIQNNQVIVDKENNSFIPVDAGNRHFEPILLCLIEKGLVEQGSDGEIKFRPDGKFLVDGALEELEVSIRQLRSEKLAEVDVKINIAEDNDQATKDLRAYRQALRDITKQKGFPKKVTWPKEPK
jgi:hypothetical protein